MLLRLPGYEALEGNVFEWLEALFDNVEVLE